MSRIEGRGSNVELFLSSSRVDSMCDDASGDAGLDVDSRVFFWEGALQVIDALVEGPGREGVWMKGGAQLHPAGEVNGRLGNHSCDRPVAQAAGLKAAATPLQRIAIWNKAERTPGHTRHCTWCTAGELQLLRFCRVALAVSTIAVSGPRGPLFRSPFFSD